MSDRRRQARKAARREQTKLAERQRRLTSDRCADLFYAAVWAWNHRDHEHARQLLEKILRIRPNHHAAHERLAELDFAAGRFEAGLAHYHSLSQPPEWPVLTYRAAVANARMGRFDRSRSLLDEFLKSTSRQSEFGQLRANARSFRREWAKLARKEATREARLTDTEQASLPLDGSIDAAARRPSTRLLGEPAGSFARVATQAGAGTPAASGNPTPAGAHKLPVPDLPAFPDEVVPEVPVVFEIDRAGFPETVTAPDLAPAGEVVLRRRYAELRLQKGFDELLSPGASRDLTHFRHQLETVRRILRDFRGRVLLADEVGLGKTIEACLALKEYWMRGLVRKALVLTPPSLVGQWVDELTSRFDLVPATPDSPGFRRDPDGFWSGQPLVVASLALARQPAHRHRLTSVDYDLVIVDEAHVLKNRATAAWQLVNDLKKRFLLLLSATPVGNDLTELYNLILLVKPGLLSTEAQFRRDFGDLQALTESTRRDTLRKLLSEVMVRNTRAHLDVRLPRRLAATHVVRPETDEAEAQSCLARVIRERYRDASAADRWRLMTLQMQAGSSPAALRYGLRDRVDDGRMDGFRPVLDALDRVAVSAKSTALIDLARRSTDKKIVFTRFRATLDELARTLRAAGFCVAIFHGGLTATEKASAIADFEADAEILLSSEIGGEGRNLQFCRTVINYDLPWNPTVIEQRVGRVHRIGQTRDVFVFNFCLAGSVEERVLAILHDKINLFELVAGEMEMILGYLDGEHDFASLVMDTWARSQSPEGEERAFAELSDTITRAQTQYQRTAEIDRTLFSEDYEV
jgi:superfamily II DNA or RNA helicase